MERLIVELSKYVIAIFMAFYTFECFSVFRFSTEEARNGIYIRQNVFMFLVHFVAFAAICLETGDMGYLIFYAFQQIILFATIVLFKIIYPKCNRLIINNMCMLLTVSFIILTRLSYEKSLKQFKIIMISLLIAFIVPFFVRNIGLLKNLSWIYALVGVGALGIVYVLGAVTNGSKISYTILGYTFQPSEFVKIIFVFFIAGMLYSSKSIVQVAITAVLAGAHVLILVLSKDLGSGLIYFIVYVAMVFVATKNYLYLAMGLLGGSGAAMMAYRLFSHVQVRVQAWKDPWSVIDNAGFQITQSLFAIGTGGWYGLGLYKGAPDAIPYVEADFVFSAIAEELGVFFAICLILICISCFIMFMNVAMQVRDEFYKLIAVGLGVMYVFQVFLTIGGGTKFIPLTGVTLPLVSYGGSSVLSSLILFAVMEGIYIIRQDEGEKIERERKKQRANAKRRKKSKREEKEEFVIKDFEEL